MSAKDPKKEQAERMSHPAYLVITPIETLIDDGIVFDGEDEKTRIVNMTDFIRLREIIQRFGKELTGDQSDTLLRALKCCTLQADA